METKQLLFSEFAQSYCGTDDEAIQHSELLDALINKNTGDEINSLELHTMLCCGQTVKVDQKELEWGYYELTINDEWQCDSIKPII